MLAKFLAFTIGESAYCVPLLDTKEIRKIPSDDIYYENGGLKTMVRDAIGELFALHNMHKIMKTSRKVSDDTKSGEHVVFISMSETEKHAFLVDSLIGIISTETHQLIEAPSLLKNKGWVSKMLIDEKTNSIYSILNCNNILTIDDSDLRAA